MLETIQSKTADELDYTNMQQAYMQVQTAYQRLKEKTRIDIPHPARFWEYTSLIHCVNDYFEDECFSALDIGSGFSLIGPMLIERGWDVTEIDSYTSYPDHPYIGKTRASLGITWHDFTAFKLDRFKEKTFDLITSISVLEHCSVEEIENTLKNARRIITDGGMFFLTVDIVPESSGWSSTRQQEFSLHDWNNMLERIQSSDFELQGGTPDLDYHGNFVHDYTFARACFLARS